MKKKVARIAIGLLYKTKNYTQNIERISKRKPSCGTVKCQQTLSMGRINISLRTLTISCDYLKCCVITMRLH